MCNMVVIMNGNLKKDIHWLNGNRFDNILPVTFYHFIHVNPSLHGQDHSAANIRVVQQMIRLDYIKRDILLDYCKKKPKTISQLNASLV